MSGFAVVELNTNLVATSTTGAAWTSSTLPAGVNLLTPEAIVTNGTILVVPLSDLAGDGTKIVTSTDGVTWVIQTTAFISGVWDGIWNGTEFLLIGQYQPSTQYFAKSTNGTTWTISTFSVFNQKITRVAWNGSVYAGIATVGTTSLAAVSSNGTTWTAATLPSSSPWSAITSGAGIFVAVAGGPSNVAATSPNGITWTSQTLPTTSSWVAIAYGATTFCAISSGTAGAVSTNGVSWTATTIPTNANLWSAITWNGSAFCITALGGATVATSPDGVTWTTHSLPVSGSWRYISQGFNVASTIGAFWKNLVGTTETDS